MATTLVPDDSRPEELPEVGRLRDAIQEVQFVYSRLFGQIHKTRAELKQGSTPHASEWPGKTPGDPQWVEPGDRLPRKHDPDWQRREAGWPLLLEEMLKELTEFWRSIRRAESELSLLSSDVLDELESVGGRGWVVRVQYALNQLTESIRGTAPSDGFPADIVRIVELSAPESPESPEYADEAVRSLSQFDQHLLAMRQSRIGMTRSRPAFHARAETDSVPGTTGESDTRLGRTAPGRVKIPAEKLAALQNSKSWKRFQERNDRVFAVARGEMSAEEARLNSEEAEVAHGLASIPERMRLARKHAVSLDFDPPETIDDWAELARTLGIDPDPLTMGEIYDAIIGIAETAAVELKRSLKRNEWLLRVQDRVSRELEAERAETANTSQAADPKLSSDRPVESDGEEVGLLTKGPDAEVYSEPDSIDYQYEGQWLTAQFCKKRFRLSVSNLSRWARDGCPPLGGRRIRRNRIEDAANQLCFHRVDIEQLVAILDKDD